MSETTETAELPSAMPLEVDGVTFELRIFPDPSGLRGQVFDGEEKIAGVQIFHRRTVDDLAAKARRDRAVRRAVAARTASA